jgi:hypothetical protein
LLVTTALGVCIGAGIFGSAFWIKALIQTQIRGSGFPQARVGILQFTPNGLVIDHIALDANDFSTVDQISVTLDWRDLLLKRQIDSLSVKDISLMGELDENGKFRVAGWDTTLPSPSTEGGADLPFRSLFLQGLTFDLDTPQGSFRFQAKAHVEAKEDHSQVITFSAWSEQKLLSFQIDGKGQINPDRSLSVSSELLEGRVELPGFQATRLSGQGSYVAVLGTQPVIAGEIRAGSIKTLNALLQNVDFSFDTSKSEPVYFKTSPAGYPDISFVGRWNTTPPEQFELTIDSKIASDLVSLLNDQISPATKTWISGLSPLTLQVALPKDIFKQDVKKAAWAILAGKSRAAKFTGTLFYSPEQNELFVDVFPSKIDAAVLSSLFPLQSEIGLSLSGGTVDISGEGHVSLTADDLLTVRGPMNITLSNLEGDFGGFLFQNLSGVLPIPTIFPWQISAQNTPARLTFQPVNEDGTLAKGQISLFGRQDKGLTFSDISFDFAGGKISADPLTVGQGENKAVSTRIHLDKVDLDELSRLFGNTSLTAQGLLSGEIPIEIKDSKLIFKGGALNSLDKGYFKYNPEQFPASLQGDDPRMKTVREALSDFQFSLLSFEMDGPMDGHMTTTLKASGTSPVFGERPIELNLNLEGDLGKVLQQALQAGDLSSTLRSVKGEKK